MLASLKPTVVKVVNHPQALRAAVILLTLLIAALAGGAPHDYGGGR